MRIHFWGARGSLPASVTADTIRTKIQSSLKLALENDLKQESDIDTFIDEVLPFEIKGTYGSNTSCVEIRGGDEFVVCDAGTGLRDFGNSQLERGINQATYHVFMSHLHWDHISGFPFFTPAYIPGNTVHIYGFHKNLEQAFRTQQDPPGFPLALRHMGGDIQFHVLDLKEEYDIAGFKVKGVRQRHPGASYGYSFEQSGKKCIYSTDSEHQEEADVEDYHFVEFCKGADVLIFDAQYNLAEHYFEKKSWGHSSNLVGVELAVRSSVKRLLLFHHEHTVGDAELEQYLTKTRRYLEIYDPDARLQIDLAHEGMEIEV